MSRSTDPLLHRRQVIAAGGALLASALLKSNQDAVSARDAGGPIRWSLTGVNDLVSLDPAKSSNIQDFTVVGLIYGGLVRLDEKLLVVPSLAEKWDVSEDALTYTFTLREGIQFSDGTPITADDVVWTFNHALDPSTGGWTGPYYFTAIEGADDVAAGKTKEVSGVKKVYDRTVAITIKEPAAYFLSSLSAGPSKILSKAAIEAADDGAVTSGPFVVKKWNHGQGIDLVPNPKFYQPVTEVTELNFIFNQDSETGFQLYRTGAADILGSSQDPIPAARVPEVSSSPDFRSTPAFNTRYVAFNNVIEPFNNVQVRQALAHAIDRDTLANAVLGGTVTPTDRILPAGFPASDLVIEGLAFDPAAAKDLLGKAGLDPSTFTFTLSYGVEGDNERVVTVLQSMWQENLGIKVELEPLELATFSSRLNDTYLDPSKGLQSYYSIWGADYPDPQNFLSLQLQTGVGNNNSHYSNKEFDALTKEADTSVEDFAQRAELYNKAEQIAVNEVGWLPLFNAKVNVLVRECIKGIEVTGMDYQFPDWSKLAGCPS
ncbi:MAG: peptide ABC transporter substrate-binding protein [Thermomicrobiales bacterium]